MWEGVGANLQEVDKTKQALLLPAHYPITLAFNMSSVLRKVSFHPYTPFWKDYVTLAIEPFLCTQQ